MSQKRFIFSFILFAFLTACSSTTQITKYNEKNVLPIQQRAALLSQVKLWKVSGKIAFINGKQKSSASLVWQRDDENANQQLNLTTFLGINVLKLISENNTHYLTAENNTYTSKNLSQLLYKQTQIYFPVDALSYWLKGVVYRQNDHISVDPIKQVAKNLTSYANYKKWQIFYDNYQEVNINQHSSKSASHVLMPYKITIKSGNIIIKIKLSSWALTV
jgi:outer membrane lipoprotein LolB